VYYTVLYMHHLAHGWRTGVYCTWRLITSVVFHCRQDQACAHILEPRFKLVLASLWHVG